MPITGAAVFQLSPENEKMLLVEADEGNADAAYRLSKFYGLTRNDFPKEFIYLQKAAELGKPDAQYNLGVMFKNGHGVKQNLTEAAKWYRKAAEQDDADAQFSLGVLCQQGKGVEQDYVEAMKWYRKAAELGHAEAKKICSKNPERSATKKRGTVGATPGKQQSPGFWASILAAIRGK